MSEYEPQPKNWHLSWEQDKNGEYVMFRKNGRDYKMNEDDAGIFTFSHQPDADHIYYCNTDGDEMVEDYTFRAEIDDKLGEGVFDFICQEFLEHGFAWEVAEHPSEIDVLEYYARFNLVPEIVDPLDQIVLDAFKNFTAEWKYYSGEPGWS